MSSVYTHYSHSEWLGHDRKSVHSIMISRWSRMSRADPSIKISFGGRRQILVLKSVVLEIPQHEGMAVIVSASQNIREEQLARS